jgi:hypothetical protein
MYKLLQATQEGEEDFILWFSPDMSAEDLRQALESSASWTPRGVLGGRGSSVSHVTGLLDGFSLISHLPFLCINASK